jgi:hypothetical protein
MSVFISSVLSHGLWWQSKVHSMTGSGQYKSEARVISNSVHRSCDSFCQSFACRGSYPVTLSTSSQAQIPEQLLSLPHLVLGILVLLSNYCTILINLSPLCDCDTPDKNFCSSLCLEACDMGKILSGAGLCLAISTVLGVELEMVVHSRNQN